MSVEQHFTRELTVSVEATQPVLKDSYTPYRHYKKKTYSDKDRERENDAKSSVTT